MNKSYELLSGEEMNRLHPETFLIPSKVIRNGLMPGDIVKLHFKFSDPLSIERMWVIVTRKTEDGYYGILDNEPATTDNLVCGDKINFRPEHVTDIFRNSHKIH